MEPDLGAVAAVLRTLGRSETLLSPLRAYAAAVERDADRLGLVSEEGLDRFLTRHVAESLLFAAVQAPAVDERWADVGSGAGLPGIPLAIAFPEATFALIEPQQRRAGFLDLLVEDLGLSNVEVIAARAQSVRSRFGVVTTRAFSSEAGSGADLDVLELLSRVAERPGMILIEIAEAASLPTAPEGSSIEEHLVRVDDVDLRARFLSMTLEP